MVHYVWDLGFDFNAVVDNNNHSYLQNGFVILGTSPEGKPATPVGLALGDTIGFNVFNVTSGATTNGYSIIGGSITFRNAVVGQVGSPCPFDVSATVRSENGSIGSIHVGDGFAKIQISAFSSPAPHIGKSAIFSGLQNQAEFPWWGVVLPLSLTNNKGFLMTIELTVEGPGGVQRTFVVDPEMIVGSAG